jgi:hypothetical protein
MPLRKLNEVVVGDNVPEVIEGARSRSDGAYSDSARSDPGGRHDLEVLLYIELLSD